MAMGACDSSHGDQNPSIACQRVDCSILDACHLRKLQVEYNPDALDSVNPVDRIAILWMQHHASAKVYQDVEARMIFRRRPRFSGPTRQTP